MVRATRRGARYRAARRAAPTFRNDEVDAHRRRWTFYEAIKALCNFCLTLSKKNPPEPFVNLFLDAGYQAVIFRKQRASLRRDAGPASPHPSRQL